MRPGERAWVYIMDHKYGYGERGSFSFPSVPPACQLVYDVTMITCEPPDEVGGVRQVCGCSTRYIHSTAEFLVYDCSMTISWLLYDNI